MNPKCCSSTNPASGLDPRARIEIRNLLKRLGELEKTVIVSSHILPELADVCTRVGMIEKGVMIVDGYVDEVMRKARQSIQLHIGVKTNAEKAAALIEQHDDVDEVWMEKDLILARVQREVDYTFLSRLLMESGFDLTMFREEDVNLETAFMELTKGTQQ